MTFSHSRLKTYEDCPRKYAFKYLEKPPIEERPSIEAFMGKTVHEALESLYRAVQMERVPKWEEIRDQYETFWQKNWQADILIVRREFSADDYRNVGRRCLQDYFVRHYPFTESRVLALEDHVSFPLDPEGRYLMQGFIDRLAEREDGSLEIHDYKTSRRLPSQDEINRERQLALYQIGIEERWRDGRPVRLVWHYLRADRALVSTRTPEALTQLRAETIGLIDTVEAARQRNDFPPHESQLCDWCDFQSLCPAKRHLFATATLTPEQFSADDGVVLADRFVAASRRKAQAEADLQSARQEVIAFADSHKLTRLAGHHVTVGVARHTRVMLPNRDDPNRRVLEDLVRKSGEWDQVSDLSDVKLSSAVQGDLFALNLRRQIAELLRRQQIVTVTKREFADESTDDGPDLPT